MGCFSYSCSISGLPIDAGDPVMFLALCTSYERRYEAGVDGAWRPMTLPIVAQYDDYGSVEHIEEGPLTDAFFATLSKRAIEREVGENWCHDVAVMKDMPRDKWLEALWEDRVQIKGFDLSVLDVSQTMIRQDIWEFLANGAPSHAGHVDGPRRSLDSFAIRTGLKYATEIDWSLLNEDAFFEACRDLANVIHSLGSLGRPWARGKRCGPQQGDWDLQLAFAEKLVAISKERISYYEDS
jgi:hypothetical protein